MSFNDSLTLEIPAVACETGFFTNKGALDLQGLPSWLQAKAYRVAPFLLGPDQAEYSLEFWHEVVDLPNTGVLPEDVPSSMFPSSELFKLFPCSPHSYKRLPIALATDQKQAKQFAAWHRKVYGCQPYDDEFCHCFVRACLAHFGEELDVNWARAAFEHHNRRVAYAKNNPPELLAIAPGLEEQLFALGKLLIEVYQAKGISQLLGSPQIDVLKAGPGVGNRSHISQQDEQVLSTQTNPEEYSGIASLKGETNVGITKLEQASIARQKEEIEELTRSIQMKLGEMQNNCKNVQDTNKQAIQRIEKDLASASEDVSSVISENARTVQEEKDALLRENVHTEERTKRDDAPHAMQEKLTKLDKVNIHGYSDKGQAEVNPAQNRQQQHAVISTKLRSGTGVTVKQTTPEEPATIGLILKEEKEVSPKRLENARVLLEQKEKALEQEKLHAEELRRQGDCLHTLNEQLDSLVRRDLEAYNARHDEVKIMTVPTIELKLAIASCNLRTETIVDAKLEAIIFKEQAIIAKEEEEEEFFRSLQTEQERLQKVHKNVQQQLDLSNCHLVEVLISLDDLALEKENAKIELQSIEDGTYKRSLCALPTESLMEPSPCPFCQLGFEQSKIVCSDCTESFFHPACLSLLLEANKEDQSDIAFHDAVVENCRMQHVRANMVMAEMGTVPTPWAVPQTQSSAMPTARSQASEEETSDSQLSRAINTMMQIQEQRMKKPKVLKKKEEALHDATCILQSLDNDNMYGACGTPTPSSAPMSFMPEKGACPGSGRDKCLTPPVPVAHEMADDPSAVSTDIPLGA